MREDVRSWTRVRTPSGVRDVAAPARPYRCGALVEWGSITKGLVGTTAIRSLGDDCPVRDVLPDFRGVDCTVGDLVRHTSGLPRMDPSLTWTPMRDPYRPTVGRPLDPAVVVATGPRGEHVYSNLGYALLGVVLDRAHGNWFDAVYDVVLRPAGVTSATTAPEPRERVRAVRFGVPVRPWSLDGSPYAAAGGVWTTFDDLCRYADWALDVGGQDDRRVGWQHERGVDWINGALRATSAVIVHAAGVTAVTHALTGRVGVADRIATTALRDARSDQAGSGRRWVA